MKPFASLCHNETVINWKVCMSGLKSHSPATLAVSWGHWLISHLVTEKQTCSFSLVESLLTASFMTELNWTVKWTDHFCNLFGSACSPQRLFSSYMSHARWISHLIKEKGLCCFYHEAPFWAGQRDHERVSASAWPGSVMGKWRPQPTDIIPGDAGGAFVAVTLSSCFFFGLSVFFFLSSNIKAWSSWLRSGGWLCQRRILHLKKSRVAFSVCFGWLSVYTTV